MAITFVVTFWLLEWHFLLSISAVYMAVLAFFGLSSSCHRIRWSAKNKEMKLIRCENCEGESFCGFSKATKKPQMCPHCGEREVVYSLAGIS